MANKTTSEMKNSLNYLISDIKNILDTARRQGASAINTVMLNAYWKIGERIVNEEQGGKIRADYGASSLKELSRQLTVEIGKGFSPRNLKNYRLFYILFLIGRFGTRAFQI